ncbi:unnamed protein product [Ixodes pacificus]
MSVRPGLTNPDLGGTTRGSCASLDCSCGAFVTREDAFGYADCPAGWCLICGHPPAQHGTLVKTISLRRLIRHLEECNIHCLGQLWHKNTRTCFGTDRNLGPSSQRDRHVSG